MPPRPPPLRQLRAYRAVMATGGVTAAAQKLNLTQPALSKQIAALERGLGLRLFSRRRGGPLLPTAQGIAFYQAIEGTLSGIDAIPQIAAEVARHIRVRLSIAATPPLLHSALFMRAVARFTARHPGIAIALEARPRVDLEAWVASRQSDVGFGLLPCVHPDLRARVLVDTQVVATLPAGHRLARRRSVHIDALREQALILPRRQPLRERIDARHPGLASAIESSSAVTCCNLAAAGQGIALTDPFSPTGISAGLVATLPLRPSVTLQYGALLPATDAPHGQIEELLELASECFSALRPGVGDSATTTLL